MHGSIRVEKPKFFSKGSKFRLEPDSFRRVKSSFCVSEKAVVFPNDLPVLNHSAIPPCK